MAGMFYSLEEVAAKLNKTEEEVKDIIKQGRLREFRDGPNLLFKVNEVEALMSDTSIKTSAKAKLAAEDEEIFLAPEPGDDGGKGIDALDSEDGDYKLAEDDTLGETKVMQNKLGDDTLSEGKVGSGEASLEEIEGDVNLDTFGSGSGLLDLSLQADDTSLGGILDEIYTPEGEEGKEGEAKPDASAVEVAADAEQLIPDEGLAAAEIGAEAPAIVQAYYEAAPDAVSNALGIMLILPFAAVVYTIIVTLADDNNMIPVVRTAVQGIIWYIALGAAAVSGLIIGAALMMGGKGKRGKTAVKEPKAKKAKKEKKAKKGKETKEASQAEAEPESKSD